jgi:hypothetical protein
MTRILNFISKKGGDTSHHLQKCIRSGGLFSVRTQPGFNLQMPQNDSFSTLDSKIRVGIFPIQRKEKAQHMFLSQARCGDINAGCNVSRQVPSPLCMDACGNKDVEQQIIPLPSLYSDISHDASS